MYFSFVFFFNLYRDIEMNFNLPGLPNILGNGRGIQLLYIDISIYYSIYTFLTFVYISLIGWHWRCVYISLSGNVQTNVLEINDDLSELQKVKRYSVSSQMPIQRYVLCLFFFKLSLSLSSSQFSSSSCFLFR